MACCSERLTSTRTMLQSISARRCATLSVGRLLDLGGKRRETYSIYVGRGAMMTVVHLYRAMIIMFVITNAMLVGLSALILAKIDELMEQKPPAEQR
jgi:hypothetical protein